MTVVMSYSEQYRADCLMFQYAFLITMHNIVHWVIADKSPHVPERSLFLICGFLTGLISSKFTLVSRMPLRI